MRIECFTAREWYKIADTISRYCPSEPLVEKLPFDVDKEFATAVDLQ